LLTIFITTVLVSLHSPFTTFIISCKFDTIFYVYKLRLVEDFRAKWVCLFWTASSVELELIWPHIEWL